jgi:RNA polymerase sigma-70 factor, ECF subfamily
VSSANSLVTAFVASSPASLRTALGTLPDLGQRLTTLHFEGRAAWPQLALEPAALMAFVARQLPAESSEEIVELLEGLRPGDLYLACACACGDDAAINAFDRCYMSEVDHALARMRIDASRLADVKQLVRQRLFVGTGPTAAVGAAGAPGGGKINEYAGRGDLRRWVRSVAVRTCLNDLRKGKREVLADDETLIARQAIPVDDPEVAYMKRTYSQEFRAAFSEALSRADAREQTLLRYHHVDGLNIDEIGAIYRVHRVTAFRWLEKAKERLVRTTLEDLRARLRLSPRELDSVLRMIRSQVHLSLIRHLGGPRDRIENDAIEIDASELVEVADGNDQGAQPVDEGASYAEADASWYAGGAPAPAAAAPPTSPRPGTAPPAGGASPTTPPPIAGVGKRRPSTDGGSAGPAPVGGRRPSTGGGSGGSSDG